MTAPVIWAPYCGAAPVPADLLARWNADPVLLAALVAVAWLFRNGGHRGLKALGLALALLLFVSPFCALTSALFSARTVHHLALTALLAPLLVEALRVRWRIGLAAATFAFAAIFWLWHAPPFYAAALSSDLVYWLMQASLLGAAIAFWASVRNAAVPAGVAALLITTVQMGLLGALLTFSTSPFYAPHALTTGAWGLTALEDQQLAGLIMWAPGAGLYLIAALALAARLLRPESRWSVS